MMTPAQRLDLDIVFNMSLCVDVGFSLPTAEKRNKLTPLNVPLTTRFLQLKSIALCGRWRVTQPAPRAEPGNVRFRS